jgi:hypothetical protein
MTAGLDEIIRSVTQRDGKSSSGETLVVASHVSQMAQWSVRKGIRFIPEQDDEKQSRKKKIAEVVSYNRLDLYYKGIVTLFLTTGSILWYLRPTGTANYEIHWFRGGEPNNPECQYKAYYKPGGRELQEVIIRYSYEDYSTNNYNSLNTFDRKKWIRLRITAEYIIEEIYSQIPSLYPDSSPMGLANLGMMSAPLTRNVQMNSLGFIPCAVSPNYPMQPGDSGNGEFNWLRGPIEAEDSMRSAMLDNVFLFSSPTLVTTRSKAQVMEAVDGNEGQKPSWSSQQGYYSNTHPSTRRDDPWVRGNRYGQGMGDSNRRSRIARIIGGVTSEERFGYIFPDPINGDQWKFVESYREGIHEALGGIDPLGMRSGMTFGEVKSLFGKVAATALDKCKSLWSYGLSKILEMMLQIEEETFLASYKNYLLTTHKNAKKFQNLVKKNGAIPDAIVLQDYTENQFVLPLGVSGLAPYGDRSINWKWEGPVFEMDPREQLDLSIGVRNYQELGVGSLQAMQYLFPDKDEREIRSMLTGVPFRFIASVSSSIGTLLQLQQQMMGTPDPQNPNIPLAARFDLTPLIQQQILSLAREISYGPEFYPNNNDSGSGNSANFSGNQQPGSGLSGVSPPGSSVPGTLSPVFSGVSPGISNAGNGSNGTTNVNARSSAQLQQRVSEQRNPVPGTASGYAAGLYPNASAIPGTAYPGWGMANGTGGNATPGIPEWASPIPSPGSSTVNAAVPGLPTTVPTTATGLPAGIPAGLPPDFASSPSLWRLYL